MVAFILLYSASLFAQDKPLHVLGVDIAGVFDEKPIGRERLIVQELAKCMGRELKVTLAPYGRHISFFAKAETFDAVATVPPEQDVFGYRSISHIDYENGVSTLASFKSKIASIKDLKGLRVVSFKGAEDLLPGMKEAVPSFASYAEIANQELHSKMLLLERIDAVVSDRYIFYMHTKKLRDEAPTKKEFAQKTKFHSVFSPSHFLMSFRKKSDRDAFNSCVNSKKEEIKRINLKYQARP